MPVEKLKNTRYDGKALEKQSKIPQCYLYVSQTVMGRVTA